METCQFRACTQPALADGLCKAHLLTRRMIASRYRPHAERRRCGVDGCDDYHHGRGMCNRHHAAWRYYTKQGREADIPFVVPSDKPSK